MATYQARHQNGILNEYLGLIFFILFLLGLFAPLIVEMLAYAQQTQELDRITKIAVQRACSLGIDPLGCVAADAKQCAFSVGIDISPMERIAYKTFVNETSNPSAYGCNPASANARNPCVGAEGGVQFLVYDALGKDLEISKSSNFVFDIPGGSLGGQYYLYGSNVNHSLCPSYKNQTTWNYCMQNSFDPTLSNILRPMIDISHRLQAFQPGRCDDALPGPCRNAFSAIVDRCVVCAQKTRESVFERSIFGQVLSCRDDSGNLSINKFSFIPCKIRTCSSVKYNPPSLKRDYNLAYQGEIDSNGNPISNPYLLDNYSSEEINPLGWYNRGASQPPDRNQPSRPPANLFERMNDIFN
ncbi:MAG: hypothetical protein SFT81_00135 [Candidatus Caenarcaniphilales bacterium]|nr:hypothetical protein [Candidatus Caenarcaniphilales bacterium]